jgi:hypothetical protein
MTVAASTSAQVIILSLLGTATHFMSLFSALTGLPALPLASLI